MSRPQFNQQHQPSQSTLGPIVNGGLIDFQDNLQRGVCEYATPNQLMAAGYGALPPGLSYPVPVQPQVGVYPSYQGHQASPQLSSAGQGGTCISGPPSFFHVNGVLYRPVEDASQGHTPPLNAAGAVVNAPPPLDPATMQGAKVLTEDELHRTIDARVRQKVDSYLSSQRKPHHARGEDPGPPSTARAHEHRADSSASPRTHRAPVGASHSPAVRSSSHRVSSDEALAIQRVQHANASMRVPAPSASRGADGKRSGPNW